MTQPVATAAQIQAAAQLAALLWPGHTGPELAAEFSQLLAQGNAQLFLCNEGGIPIGFAQCQLRRDYVEGTSSSPVGYLEGIFVKEGFRRRGHARALLAACEAWAKRMGCREFASDCLLENEDSLRFHTAVRFRQVNRIICFAKKL